MKTTFIYTLSDPDTLEVRYIGKANNLKYRLWAHIQEAKNDSRNQRKCNWIKKLLLQNKKPIIEILEEVPLESWKKSEIYWIAQFKTWGFRLINMTSGGESGIISENCKKALQNSKRGHIKGMFKHSEETKALIKEKRANQVVTEDHKRKISESLKGRKKSDSHRKNISEGRKKLFI